MKYARYSLLIALLLFPFCSKFVKGTHPQNVLLITMDTTRWDYFQYAIEHPPSRFPLIHLRSLINDSAQFQQAVATINCTNPSHLSILTSLFPAQHGVHSNEQRYEKPNPTLAEILTKQGFHTAAGVSAYHLGNPKLDLLRGFTDKAVPQGAFTATEITDLAMEWLAKPQHEKYFLWIHYFDPHAVYNPPSQYVMNSDDVLPPEDRHDAAEDGKLRVLDRDPFFVRSGFGRLWENWIGKEYRLNNVKRMYMGEVLYMCNEIDRLINYLQTSKYAGKTVVILVADHGESLGEHQIYFDHMGLYDPQIRVPLIFYYPPEIQAAKISRQVSTLDILPTILDFLNVSLSAKISGSSLVPLMKRGKSTNKVVYDAIIENTDLTQVTYRTPKWKLILPVKTDRVLQNGQEMFDLSNDGKELKNVLAENEKLAEPMRKALQQYLQQSTSSTHPALTKEELEKLRALGYVN